MRIAFGLSMDGSTRPPRVDGQELTDLEWAVWFRIATAASVFTPWGGDDAVRLLRAHFGGMEKESADETP